MYQYVAWRQIYSNTNGKKIYIITARPEKHFKKYVIPFLDINSIDSKKIYFLSSSGIPSKYLLLERYNIKFFFDDSDNVLNKIKEAAKEKNDNVKLFKVRNDEITPYL